MSKLRNGLTRAGLVPVRGLGRLPPRAARGLTASLAGPMRMLMKRRARIARRNLALCFPGWNDAQREATLRRHFRLLAESVADIAQAWCRPGQLGPAFGSVSGLEHVEAARTSGRGVLLITGHVTCLELGARLFGEQVAACGIYRPLRNPVLDAFQNQGRQGYALEMIPRHDLRAMVRHLRAGGILWYAPDQDFGADRSLFVPFFGQPAATARGIIELARLGRAAVVPMYPLQDLADRRVEVMVAPELPDFAAAPAEQSLAAFNHFLEGQIRRSPAQYWWLHRRFKSAPPGLPDRYREPTT
ncbi:MAG: lysophospholipid acyltransferase family protein [Wenzhouxiangella sp.]